MPADELTPLHLLQHADLEIEGRMPWSSNATFRCHLLIDGEPVGQAIYKPLAASGRCGTSSPACTGARWPPIC